MLQALAADCAQFCSLLNNVVTVLLAGAKLHVVPLAVASARTARVVWKVVAALAALV
jgi:hypothetical protein